MLWNKQPAFPASLLRVGEEVAVDCETVLIGTKTQIEPLVGGVEGGLLSCLSLGVLDGV